VASGAIDKDLLYEVISSVINEPEINEEIKLKIFEAISNHEN
jgi:death-on-curing protein